MRFGSGSYNVRLSEGINPSLLRPSHRSITCTVFFLDGSERQFNIDRNATGQQLIDRVFTHLELVEKDFFGLQFLCVVDTRDTQQKRWLEPHKSVRKQMLCPPYNLFFRVKFYVSDPAKLVEEYTRYHFFLQIRKDLLDGKLQCAEGSMALLGSYAVQSEMGDYCEEENGSNYLDNYKVSPNQPSDIGRKIEELHRMHKGQSPAEAEFNFLDHAKRLEMYGVELYEARDGKGLPIAIGVNSFGMIVFHERKKINEFPWSSIMKISFKRKQFFVHIRMEDNNGMEDDTCLVFTINTSPSCKQLWKSCIEHHTFFRLIAPPVVPPKGLFHIGSRYRYSGRTEFQTMEEMKNKARIERTFERSTSRNGLSSRATISCAPSTTSSTTYTPTPTLTASPDLSSRLFSRSQSWALRFLPGKRTVNLAVPQRSPVPDGIGVNTRMQHLTAPSTDIMRKKNSGDHQMGRHLSLRHRRPPPSPSLTNSAHPTLNQDDRDTVDGRSTVLDGPMSRSLSLQSCDDRLEIVCAVCECA